MLTFPKLFGSLLGTGMSAGLSQRDSVVKEP